MHSVCASVSLASQPTSLRGRSKDGCTPRTGSKAVHRSNGDRIAGVFPETPQSRLSCRPSADNRGLQRAVHHADEVDVLLLLAAVHGVADELAVPRFPRRDLQLEGADTANYIMW